MKTSKVIVAGVAVAACLLIGSEGRAADVTVGADVASAYVWRGLTFNDGLVVQPSLDTMTPAGIGINAWGNFDVEDYNGAVESSDFSEVDLTLSYAIPEDIEQLDLGIGYIEYLFPQGGAASNTRELYGDVAIALMEDLSAGGFFAYDVDEVEDFYANVSLAYGYDVNEELTMELAGLLGFAGSDFAAGKESGMHEYNIALSAEYAVNEATALTAFLAYTDAIDDDVLPDAALDVDVYGGAGVYYSF